MMRKAKNTTGEYGRSSGGKSVRPLIEPFQLWVRTSAPRCGIETS